MIIRHYEEDETLEKVETDFDQLQNLQYEGLEKQIFDDADKPDGALTFEEIQYVYGDLNDYKWIGLYRDSKGKLERLYQAK